MLRLALLCIVAAAVAAVAADQNTAAASDVDACKGEPGELGESALVQLGTAARRGSEGQPPKPSRPATRRPTRSPAMNPPAAAGVAAGGVAAVAGLAPTLDDSLQSSGPWYAQSKKNWLALIQHHGSRLIIVHRGSTLFY